MRSVLLDTSFFLRFLNEKDILFENADGYYRYFLEKNIAMKCSTVSVAEYCVKGKLDELPFKDLQILPFNINHAQRAGELTNLILTQKGKIDLPERKIILNDIKLFAQADVEVTIDVYLTYDIESKKIYSLLQKDHPLRFQFLDLRIKHTEAFGVLDLKAITK